MKTDERMLNLLETDFPGVWSLRAPQPGVYSGIAGFFRKAGDWLNSSPRSSHIYIATRHHGLTPLQQGMVIGASGLALAGGANAAISSAYADGPADGIIQGGEIGIGAHQHDYVGKDGTVVAGDGYMDTPWARLFAWGATDLGNGRQGLVPAQNVRGFSGIFEEPKHDTDYDRFGGGFAMGNMPDRWGAPASDILADALDLQLVAWYDTQHLKTRLERSEFGFSDSTKNIADLSSQFRLNSGLPGLLVRYHFGFENFEGDDHFRDAVQEEDTTIRTHDFALLVPVSEHWRIGVDGRAIRDSGAKTYVDEVPGFLAPDPRVSATMLSIGPALRFETGERNHRKGFEISGAPINGSRYFEYGSGSVDGFRLRFEAFNEPKFWIGAEYLQQDGRADDTFLVLPTTQSYRQTQDFQAFSFFIRTGESISPRFLARSELRVGMSNQSDLADLLVTVEPFPGLIVPVLARNNAYDERRWFAELTKDFIKKWGISLTARYERDNEMVTRNLEGASESEDGHLFSLTLRKRF